MSTAPRYDAVIFDLLTALLDSWTVWNRAAGSEAEGMRWRREYLKLTYECGAYRPYELLVAEAASRVGLQPVHAEALLAGWETLQPWPEAPALLRAIANRGLPLGVATNCSAHLGQLAANRVGVAFAAVVTSEDAGYYKPRPEPYLAALNSLGTDPARTLFVAGSPADVPGAAGVGMTVFWHNRAGLPPVGTGPQAFLVAKTLHPLLDLVG